MAVSIGVLFCSCYYYAYWYKDMHIGMRMKKDLFSTEISLDTASLPSRTVCACN
jgi:hypothetical protein